MSCGQPAPSSIAFVGSVCVVNGEHEIHETGHVVPMQWDDWTWEWLIGRAVVLPGLGHLVAAYERWKRGDEAW